MKKLVLGILSTLILTTNVLANEIETKKVISTGVGLTESEALKDTTRNAVQQVVGSYILSDTYVKNSQLIKDEILINSNGFVKGFKIISQTKDSSGLIKIEAEVEVEPSNVTKRLGELNIALKDVATTEFKAISLDKFKATKDFKKMFDEIVLKPIKENKQIYDIKIGELKSVDKLDFENSNPSLMPFILSFSITLKNDYVDLVKDFLNKSSVQKYDYLPSNFNSFDKSIIFVDYLSYKKQEQYKNIFVLDDKVKKLYNELIYDFFDNYNPAIYINFKDNSNNIINPIKMYLEYTHNNYLNNSSDFSKLFCKDCYSVADIFAIKSDYYKERFFIKGGTKNLDLGLYLGEEDVSQIKSASIEIKWEKK